MNSFTWMNCFFGLKENNNDPHKDVLGWQEHIEATLTFQSCLDKFDWLIKSVFTYFKSSSALNFQQIVLCLLIVPVHLSSSDIYSIAVLVT